VRERRALVRSKKLVFVLLKSLFTLFLLSTRPDVLTAHVKQGATHAQAQRSLVG
jgi:hypothetical protein